MPFMPVYIQFTTKMPITYARKTKANGYNLVLPNEIIINQFQLTMLSVNGWSSSKCPLINDTSRTAAEHDSEIY